MRTGESMLLPDAGAGGGERERKREMRTTLPFRISCLWYGGGMGVFHLLTLTRVPLVTSVYVHGLLCVGVWDEVQRDAGESVQLLRTLTSDVFVDFFKAVSAYVTPQ